MMRKIMASSAFRQLGDQLCSVLLEYFLEQQTHYAPNYSEDYALKIRFCAGGLTKLYQDWFSGALQCSLEELNRRGEHIVRNIIAR